MSILLQTIAGLLTFAIGIVITLHVNGNPEEQVKIEPNINEVSPDSASILEETADPSIKEQVEEILKEKEHEKKVQEYKEDLILLGQICKILSFLIPIFGIGFILKMIISGIDDNQ